MPPSMRWILLAPACLVVAPCVAQEGSAIRDNSFFVEEAYNQEAGIVQHVLTLQTFGEWFGETAMGLVGEYPLGGESHQLSVTVPVISRYHHPKTGLGEVAVGYRYQLLHPAGGVALAPRISVLLPTRSRHLGPCEPGVEVNLPVSAEWGSAVVLHGNVGGTLVRVTHSDGDATGWVPSMNAGASCVVVLHPRLNFMLEGSVRLAGERGSAGGMRHLPEYVISPGVRAALDLGTLQIVPGVALPVRFTSSAQEAGVFAYLSFEHPV